MTPDNSFSSLPTSPGSLTTLFRSTPVQPRSSLNGDHMSKTVIREKSPCTNQNNAFSDTLDSILYEIIVMKESYNTLDVSVSALENNANQNNYQSLQRDIRGLSSKLDEMHKKVRDLNLQSHNRPHTVCELTYEVPTFPCQNRFAVLSDDDDGRPGVEGATNDSSPLNKGTPVPAPWPHAIPRRRGSRSSQKSQPPQPMPRNIPRGWQGQKRKTKVSIVGSSLVRGLGPLVNDKKTEACCYTNPGGSIEIIAPTLGDVMHADDDVIVIGARFINIPKDDVPTIIKRAGALVDDLQRLRLNANVVIAAIPRRYDCPDERDTCRDKIDRVNIFLRHRCQKNPKLHYLSHNLCFSDHERDGLHLNEAGSLKYATKIKAMIGRIVDVNR